MFSWFRSPPPAPTTVEVVWISEVARLDALARFAQAHRGPLLIVAFFDDTVAAVVARFAAAGIEVDVGAQPPDVHAVPRVVLADDVRRLARRLPADVVVWVAESHPLTSLNALLVDAVGQRSDATPTFHVALDEPLMRRFGGASIARVSERMGMPPDEPIAHALITKSLANMRAKVAAKVRHPRPARSMAAWVEAHLGPA